MTRSVIVAVATAVLALASSRAHAATCVIDAVSPVTFVGYDVLSASPLDIDGSVTYKCLVSLSITIDISAGGSHVVSQRQMARTGGGTALNYNLFVDAARTQVWGDGTGATGHYGPVIGVLADFTVPIYGRIPARQDVQSGSFTDTVVVTLNF